MQPLKLQGRVIEKLTVLRHVPTPEEVKPDKHWWWLCRCECGNEITARSHDLGRGRHTSCGKCEASLPLPFLPPTAEAPMSVPNTATPIKPAKIRALIFSNFPPDQYEAVFGPKFQRLGIDILGIHPIDKGMPSKIPAGTSHLIALIEMMSAGQRERIRSLARREGLAYVPLERRFASWPTALGIDPNDAPPTVAVAPEMSAPAAPPDHELVKEVRDARSMAKMYEDDNEVLAAKVKGLEARLVEREKEHEKIIDELEGEKAQIRASVEGFVEELRRGSEVLTNLQAEVTIKRNLVAERDATIMRLTKEKGEMEQRLSVARVDLSKAAADVSKLRADLVNKRPDTGALHADLEKTRQEIVDLTAQLRRAESDLTRQRGRLVPTAEAKKLIQFLRVGIETKMITHEEALEKLSARFLMEEP